MIWIITICTALQCGTYAFSTEEDCIAHAKVKQVSALECTPMLLWKNNGQPTIKKST